MKLSEIIRILSAKIHASGDLDILIHSYKASNLLSEILRGPADNSILLTKLDNIQVIRTAEITDMRAVILAHHIPSDEMIQMAANSRIPLLSTKYQLSQCCELLQQYGLHSW